MIQTILILWIPVAMLLATIYYLWSRQRDEYQSARNFEDTIAFTCCALWPIAVPVSTSYAANNDVVPCFARLGTEKAVPSVFNKLLAQRRIATWPRDHRRRPQLVQFPAGDVGPLTGRIHL